ncbi:MurR/RpiR family transcriptional regulator [Diplocloster hominis]|uniref:MurR/RpiR family transcriptional regulator n=1 Tax=Diplocloster hominis TaxID=3079010 RepID=UPI0031BB80DB
MEEHKTVLENIDLYYDQLFIAEKKVADCIRKNPQKAVMLNVTGMANESGASEATVIRMCKHIGYQGYYQMRLILSGDLGRDGRFEASSSNPDMDSVKQVFEQSSRNISAMIPRLESGLLLECASIISQSRLVYVVAVGNTIPIALDLSFRLERFGIASYCTSIAEHFLNHISLGKPDDVLIAISRSGISKQVLQAVNVATKMGMKIIAITAEEHSLLSKDADYVLLSTAENSLFGSKGPDSPLCEIAVSDALLYFIQHREKIRLGTLPDGLNSHLDEIELILAETKL